MLTVNFLLSQKPSDLFERSVTSKASSKHNSAGKNISQVSTPTSEQPSPLQSSKVPGRAMSGNAAGVRVRKSPMTGVCVCAHMYACVCMHAHSRHVLSLACVKPSGLDSVLCSRPCSQGWVSSESDDWVVWGVVDLAGRGGGARHETIN